MNTYLAVDFGGGSGRVMAGTIDNGRLTLEEVYRFPNRQIRMGNYISVSYTHLTLPTT